MPAQYAITFKYNARQERQPLNRYLNKILQ